MPLILSGDTGVPASGMPTGSVIQTVNAQVSGATVSNSNSFTDVAGVSVSITPTSSSSKILVLVRGSYDTYSTSYEGRGYYRVLRGATDISGSLQFGWFFNPDMTNDGNTYGSISTAYLDSPATTSSTTYKVQIATIATSPQVYIERGGITLLEIKV